MAKANWQGYFRKNSKILSHFTSNETILNSFLAQHDYNSAQNEYENLTRQYKENLSKVIAAVSTFKLEQVRDLKEAEKAEKAKSFLPSNAEVENIVVSFYGSRGEWAGIFRISNVLRIRLERASDDYLMAHVRYKYIYIPGNPKGRNDSGTDERTFTLLNNGRVWRVSQMSGNMSARF
jgi:hypothetical protein